MTSRNRSKGLWTAYIALATAHCAAPEGESAPGVDAALPPGLEAMSSAPKPSLSVVAAPGDAPVEPGGPPANPRGGQTGDDSGQFATTCDVLATRTLAFDELSPLGFAPNDQLPLALGSRRLTLSWLDAVWSTEGVLETYAPGAPGEVQLDIQLRANEARIIERGDIERGTRCADRVEVDVRVAVTTADGALREQLDSVLELAPGFVWLSAELAIESLQGDLVFNPPTLDGLEPSKLRLSSTFTRYGIEGRIEQFYGTGTNRSRLRAAQWPVWGDCSARGTPALYEQQNPSTEGLLEMVRGTPSMVLRNASGLEAPVALELTAKPQTACFAPLGTGFSGYAGDELNVFADLKLSSDALPRPVHLPIELLGTFAPGAQEIELATLSLLWFPCGDASYYSPEDFVTHCGDWGIDASGYESVFLDVYDSRFTRYDGYAVFRIRGSTYPGCAASPDGFICADGVSPDTDVVTLGEVRVYFE